MEERNKWSVITMEGVQHMWLNIFNSMGVL